jgi:hypothetical protein
MTENQDETQPTGMGQAGAGEQEQTAPPLRVVEAEARARQAERQLAQLLEQPVEPWRAPVPGERQAVQTEISHAEEQRAVAVERAKAQLAWEMSRSAELEPPAREAERSAER